VSITKIVMLVILLFCSALVSGAEVAFFSLSQTDLNEIKATKTSVGNIIVRLLEKPKKLLATILVANNFINIAIVLLFNSLGEILFLDLNSTIFGVIDVRFIVEVVIIAFLILLFGEILPKIYASRNRVKFAHFVAYPLNILDKVF